MFDQIYPLVAPHSLLSYERLHGLYQVVVQTHDQGLPGDIMECGVARGGSAAMMGLTLMGLRSNKTLWVCDTFEGIPAATANDPPEAQQYNGAFKGSLDEVQSLFDSLGIDPTKCRFVKGLFQETLPSVKAASLAVLHLDGDWYESTKCCLEQLYDRVTVGGYLQIDDYGHWSGCRKAVDEFFASRNLLPELAWLDYTGVQLKKKGV